MKNNFLNEAPVYTGQSPTPTHLHLYTYTEEECRESAGNTFAELIPVLERKEPHWLHVHGLNHIDTIRKICDYYKINFLTLQDILNPHHPAKIEEHPEFNFAVLKLLNKERGVREIRSQQVCLVQGSNFLITFMEQENDFFAPVIEALKENILQIRLRGSDYLLSVLLNQFMGRYNTIVNEIDEALEGMEEELLSIAGKTHIGGRIQICRRQYLVLKKAIMPLKEQYPKLMHAQNALVRDETRIFFMDVNDHLQLALQTLEICREMLASLVDLYISNNDLRMNNIMKRLTAVSTIFIPLTFLVGVWGMNFTMMPELYWKYGYLAAWGLMIIVAVGVSYYLKKKDWY